MRTFTLTLNHLPDRRLSPNSRVHWSVRSKVTKNQREEAGWLAKAEWRNQKSMQKAVISYKFFVKSARHRDVDNLVAACKSYQDGLVDAGVIEKDDSRYLSTGFSEIARGFQDMTIITVQEV